MTIVGRLARHGLRRGVLEGSRGWLWVGLGAVGLRVLARVVSPEPETVYRSELEPGRGLEIRTVRPTRRGTR
jgi:hypothetical protein